MACECLSGNRVLVLSTSEYSSGFQQLFDFSLGKAWQVDHERGMIHVLIGPGGPWSDVQQVVNFLRTILDDQQLASVRSGWLSGCCSSPRAMDDLDDVKRLVDRADDGASPLLEILQNRRVETWFQPVFTRELSLWGYECLMRCRDAHGELHMPGTVLKWANAERLTFMLDRVCRETHIANAASAGLPAHTRILINFLPTAIYDPAFCLRTTESAVKKTGIDRCRIIFEAVESEKVGDTHRLVRILDYYRKAGYGVALDDVGAGYAGLTMLAELNPDLIKIDRELVRHAHASKTHLSICKALVTLARDFGKLVLAEGVETQQEADCLLDLGVDLLQGFHYGKPAPLPVTSPAIASAA